MKSDGQDRSSCLLAQAGSRFPGPGLGCGLGRGTSTALEWAVEVAGPRATLLLGCESAQCAGKHVQLGRGLARRRAAIGPLSKPSGQMQRMHSKACKLSLLLQKQILKNFVSFSISVQFEPTG
jgi:hypothetical protein